MEAVSYGIYWPMAVFFKFENAIGVIAPIRS